MNDDLLRQVRKEYKRSGLEEINTPLRPIDLFQEWLEAAVAADIVEPNGMAVATATPDGHPSVRIVLLKGYDEAGFVFFTNYLSRKGQEIAANPHAAATFWWTALERQVRIEGKIEKLAAAESDAYFQSRPRGSRLGAWASPQSDVISDREMLEEKLTALHLQYGEEIPIPRPDHWGGYRLKPQVIEFWQGRPNRLHDRLQFRRTQNGEWQRVRLAP
ncbi:MAG: pyridoxamine 5'-phosphate oxidase [Ardenticatenaceae bacterium]|nr:pyridoxamine 5'-phosphate oxidase [Ardenticatenaceae bacterium]